jgi:hypothetical protein
VLLCLAALAACGPQIEQEVPTTTRPLASETRLLEFDKPKTSHDQLLVYQGDYRKLGTVDEIAPAFAKYDVVVLAHVARLNDEIFPNPTNIRDARYPEMAALIREIRRHNPTVQIYGYVSGPADAWPPSVTWRYVEPGTVASWRCPEGKCSNFVFWVNQWRALVQQDPTATIDGIFIDLVAAAYMTPATRDNVFSFVKRRGLKIMANAPMTAANFEFAAASRFITARDTIFSEGFFIGEGKSRAPQAGEILDVYRKYRQLKGVKLAVWVTEARAQGELQTIRCHWSNPKQAYAAFLSAWRPENVFGYMRAGQGLVSNALRYCNHREFRF